MLQASRKGHVETDRLQRARTQQRRNLASYTSDGPAWPERVPDLEGCLP
jgi:hypothetical protein